MRSIVKNRWFHKLEEGSLKIREKSGWTDRKRGRQTLIVMTLAAPWVLPVTGF